jgi:hypothetical protein
MESDMRWLAHLDLTMARHFSETPGELRTIDFPELAHAVTAATPHPVGNDVCVAELRGAATQLRTAVRRYRRAVSSQSSEIHAGLLEAETLTIERFSTAIEQLR